MPTLDRNGVGIHYEDHGQGPAILLSHGYSATSQMWAKQVEAFQAVHSFLSTLARIGDVERIAGQSASEVRTASIRSSGS
jgi:pimeloyl-ACP methyl ester carboxylesterase